MARVGEVEDSLDILVNTVIIISYLCRRPESPQYLSP